MIAISAADNFKLQTRRQDHRCRPQLLDIFNDLSPPRTYRLKPFFNPPDLRDG